MKQIFLCCFVVIYFPFALLHLLNGNFAKFVCQSERGFPEFFKSHPTYSPSTFQRVVIAIFPLTGVFFETPCIYATLQNKTI